MVDFKKQEIEKKHEYSSLDRYMHKYRQEQEEEQDLINEYQTKKNREAYIAKEEDLAREVDKLKREELRQLRLR